MQEESLMNWSFFTKSRRLQKVQQPTPRFTFRPGVERLEDRTVPSPVIFTVDATNSQLTLSGDLGGGLGGPIREQGPGALTTNYTGSFDTDVDLAGQTIAFINDGPTANALDSGSWQPLPGGGAGSAPANYGGMVDTIFGRALVAIREAQFAAASGPLALAGGGPTYTFPSTQTFLVNHGFLDYQSFVSGREDLSGRSGTNAAPDGSLTDNGDGTLSITVPVHLTTSGTIQGLPFNLTIDGVITGNGSLGGGGGGGGLAPLFLGGNLAGQGLVIPAGALADSSGHSLVLPSAPVSAAEPLTGSTGVFVLEATKLTAPGGHTLAETDSLDLFFSSSDMFAGGTKIDK
jgi:hypothetical protein